MTDQNFVYPLNSQVGFDLSLVKQKDYPKSLISSIALPQIKNWRHWWILPLA